MEKGSPIHMIKNSFKRIVTIEKIISVIMPKIVERIRGIR